MTSSKKKRFTERKKEGYYKQAKKDQVRARSYYKLEQLDKKFSLINDNMSIIDLGAAPGGWLQYIDKKIKTGNVIGIDLLEIKKRQEFSRNIRIIMDDFNNIEEYVDEPFDLVLSDMAPEFSGDSKRDRGMTHMLNLKTLEFSKEHLKTGGNCAFKTFEGEDLEYIKKEAKKLFKEVRDFKPNSSQKKSAEFFIVCLNKIKSKSE